MPGLGYVSGRPAGHRRTVPFDYVVDGNERALGENGDPLYTGNNDWAPAAEAKPREEIKVEDMKVEEEMLVEFGSVKQEVQDIKDVSVKEEVPEIEVVGVKEAVLETEDAPLPVVKRENKKSIKESKAKQGKKAKPEKVKPVLASAKKLSKQETRKARKARQRVRQRERKEEERKEREKKEKRRARAVLKAAQEERRIARKVEKALAKRVKDQLSGLKAELLDLEIREDEERKALAEVGKQVEKVAKNFASIRKQREKAISKYL